MINFSGRSEVKSLMQLSLLFVLTEKLAVSLFEIDTSTFKVFKFFDTSLSNIQYVSLCTDFDHNWSSSKLAFCNWLTLTLTYINRLINSKVLAWQFVHKVKNINEFSIMEGYRKDTTVNICCMLNIKCSDSNFTHPAK